MTHMISMLTGAELPASLLRLSDPPDQLYVDGPLKELLKRPRVALVGSRKVTSYGRAITTQLARELGSCGVVIMSGLALGVDSIAHQACMEAGGQTIAVLPSDLHTIYPRSHQGLAQQILKTGGALLSEYPESAPVMKHNFIARNRLIAALSDGVLITEAAAKSGSLHTANFALEQGLPVMAVPGDITSPTSQGTNNLIKTGAAVVTNADDVFQALGLERIGVKPTHKAHNHEQQKILDLLRDGVCDGHEMLVKSGLGSSIFSQTLTMLEITGVIYSLGNDKWGLR